MAFPAACHYVAALSIRRQKYKKKRNRTNEIPFFLYLCIRKHYGGAFGRTAWGVADDYMEFIL